LLNLPARIGWQDFHEAFTNIPIYTGYTEGIYGRDIRKGYTEGIYGRDIRDIRDRKGYTGDIRDIRDRDIRDRHKLKIEIQINT